MFGPPRKTSSPCFDCLAQEKKEGMKPAAEERGAETAEKKAKVAAAEEDKEEEDEEELFLTDYLVQPLGRAREEEHSSDFEPDGNSKEDGDSEDGDEDEDSDDGEGDPEAQSSLKRMRSGGVTEEEIARKMAKVAEKVVVEGEDGEREDDDAKEESMESFYLNLNDANDGTAWDETQNSSPISSNAAPLDAEGDVPTPQTDPFTRPTGKKVAKELFRRDKSSSSTTGDSIYKKILDYFWDKKREMDIQKELKKDERYRQTYALEQKKVANEEQMIVIKQEKLELKRMMYDEKIMSKNISTMSGPQQEYYSSLQREIVARQSSRLG